MTPSRSHQSVLSWLEEPKVTSYREDEASEVDFIFVRVREGRVAQISVSDDNPMVHFALGEDGFLVGWNQYGDVDGIVLIMEAVKLGRESDGSPQGVGFECQHRLITTETLLRWMQAFKEARKLLDHHADPAGV